MTEGTPGGEDDTREALASPLDRHERVLLPAFLAPLVAWALHLGVSYGLVYPAIRSGSKALLYATTVSCLALSITGGLLSRSRLRRLYAAPAPSTEDRYGFAARTALILSIAMSLVIVAQTVPVVLLSLED